MPGAAKATPYVRLLISPPPPSLLPSYGGTRPRSLHLTSRLDWRGSGRARADSAESAAHVQLHAVLARVQQSLVEVRRNKPDGRGAHCRRDSDRYAPAANASGRFTPWRAMRGREGRGSATPPIARPGRAGLPTPSHICLIRIRLSPSTFLHVLHAFMVNLL